MNKNLIIGASSSGLYTALKLAKKGIPSVVFDLRNSPDEIEKRTLIITPEIFRFLKIPEELILNRIRFFEIYSLNEKIRVELKEPDIVIDRRDFLRFLHRIALRNGIEIKRGFVFEDIFKDGDRYVVKFTEKDKDKEYNFYFDNLIAANGAKSKIRDKFGIKLKKVILYQSKVILPEDYKKDTVKIWFNKKYTDYFVWLIPYSEHEGVLGLCVDEGNDIIESFKRFLNDFPFELIEPESGITTYYSPLFLPEIKINGQKIFFAGDAAGHVKMTTVGGTVTGLWGAECISKAIIENKGIKGFYRKLKFELDIHFFIRKVLENINDEELDRLLLKVEKKLKNLFYYTTRDSARKLIFQIFQNEPYIFYLGAKKILKSRNLKYLKALI